MNLKQAIEHAVELWLAQLEERNSPAFEALGSVDIHALKLTLEAELFGSE